MSHPVASSPPTPLPGGSTPPSLARLGRGVGHLVAAGLNALLLWVSHQLLDWGWPAFLTEEFERVLGIVTTSLVVSIVAELVLVVRDRGRVRAFTDLVTAGFAFAVSLRLWDVFPFDFSQYARDWATVARLVVLAGVIGTGIAVVVNLVELAGGRVRTSDRVGGP